jgi:rhodanese-related sulfurtransferase
MKRVAILLLVPLLLGFLSVCHAEETMGVNSVPRISINELKGRLTDPQITIIDVRSPHDWDDSTTMIKGAIREDPRDISVWKDKYPKDRLIALYCN